MKSSSAQRWDVVIGAVASVIAITGLALSISLGNTTSIGFGSLNSETQKFMAVLAGMFLVLVGIKAGLRYSSKCQGLCGWRIERLLRRARRRA